jgi:hypothetical protein
MRNLTQTLYVKAVLLVALCAAVAAVVAGAGPRQP